MAHILIVEDSATEAQHLRREVEALGYQASVVANGEDGIAFVRRAPPDAVLMDVVMPGLNGFQATRELNRDPETQGVPVILVTTKDQATDRVWGLRQGARDYLNKPVDGQALGEALANVLDHG